MRSIFAIALIAFCLSACSSYGLAPASGARHEGTQLTEDERHRLYSAGLAASESPLDTDLFKDVCKKIGVFGADGRPNDGYLAFVATHVDWAMKPETEAFKREINTKEKARDYINQHLPQ